MARPKLHDDTTRQRLLRVAGDRLSRHGIDAVTVRGVATDAGVTTRAVYALFGSRTALLRTMFVDGFAAFDAALAAVADSDDPLADLRRLGLAYRQSAIDRPYLYEVMFVVDSAQFSPSQSDLELCLSSIARLQRMVVRCVDAGALTGDAGVITDNAWAIVHGLSMLELRGMLGPDPLATWEHGLTAFARGWSAGGDDR